MKRPVALLMSSSLIAGIVVGVAVSTSASAETWSKTYPLWVPSDYDDPASYASFGPISSSYPECSIFFKAYGSKDYAVTSENKSMPHEFDCYHIAVRIQWDVPGQPVPASWTSWTYKDASLASTYFVYSPTKPRILNSQHKASVY